MSNSFRELMQRKKKKILELYGLTEADWQFYLDHIANFCQHSDVSCRVVYGENCNVDQVVTEMSESDFMELAEMVLKEVFEKLGYTPEKKKKKKKKPNEPEETDEPVEVLDQEDAENEAGEEVQQEMEIIAN